MASSDRLAQLWDASLPAAQPMFGPDAVAMLGTAEGLLPADPIAATPRQIMWHPGRQLIIRYSVRTDGSPDAPDQEVVAATGDAIPKHLRDGDPAQVLAWHPGNDPWLPGLASALSKRTVGTMLQSLGASPATPQLTRRTYRPTRRAVVEVSHPDARVYLKVVPPRSVARLDEMHRSFQSTVRIPRSLGWSRDLGIAVLEGIPGRTLRQSLADPQATLPSPAALVGALNALPMLPDATPVGGPTAAVARHIDLLERILPESRAVLEELRAGCAPIPDDEPLDPVHGDFHESQVLVADGAITGLIDIDRMGRGRRVDDLAMLTGHLAAYAMSAPDPGRVRAYATGVTTLADRLVDPTELRRVTAAAMVAMATGPFRAQSPGWPESIRKRVSEAARWLASAQGNGKRSLTHTS